MWLELGVPVCEELGVRVLLGLAVVLELAVLVCEELGVPVLLELEVPVFEELDV